MIKWIVTILITLIQSSAFAVTVPLTVQERYSTNRTDAHITYGVPFAKGDNILSTANLGIAGEDAQFRVLSRYDGPPTDTDKPIRMVLVDFQDSIVADAANSYTLSDSGQGAVAGNDLAIDRSTYVEIDTGAVNARISKTSGNIFENIWIGGVAAISSPTADKWVIVYNSTTYFSSPTAITIEENGPLRCVVKVDGVFKDATNNSLIPPVTRIGETPDTPIKYTIRYTAYKNKGYIKLQATLRNENLGWAYNSAQATHNISITESYLKTTMDGLASSKTVAFSGYSDSTTSDTYELLQQETSDGTAQSYTWAYAINKNASPVATGTKYDSYADLRDAQIGLMVADRWFWQNHPIGITISGNQIKFNLWPDTGTAHRIIGGIWKTHELLYYFHGTDASFDDELAHIKKRLIARASDEYYANTNFVWGMLPETITSNYTFPAGEHFQYVIDAQAQYHRALFDADYIDPGNTYTPNTFDMLRDGRMVKLTAAPIYSTWYGWLEFGAMPLTAGYGYHNQHYDYTFLALSGFLRFDDYNMLDIAEELLQHKADIITIHDPDAPSTDAGYGYHGGQRYETDSLFSYYADYSISGKSDPRKSGHAWSKGMQLQYLLTGNQLYLDVVEQMGLHIRRQHQTPMFKTAETRNQFRGIDILVNEYQLTGNPSDIDAAWDLLENSLLIAEGGDCTNRDVFTTCTPDDTAGWIPNGYVNQYDFGVGGDAWMVEPLLKFYYLLLSEGETTKASTLKDFFLRWAPIIETMINIEGDQGTYRYDNAEYMPYVGRIGYYVGVGYSTYGTNYTNINYAYLQPYSELFTFLYLNAPSNNQHYLDVAMNIEKDCRIYTSTADVFYPVSDDTIAKIGGFQTAQSITSGSFKIPKFLTKSTLLLRTISGLSAVPDDPVCDSSHLSLCASENCAGAGGNWCTDVCQVAACEAEPTCADLTQNGDETGIDCGGSCPNDCSAPAGWRSVFMINGDAVQLIEETP